MDPRPLHDLAVLLEGGRHLLRRPAQALLVVAAGALLGAVGPALQLGLHLPADPNTTTLLAAAGLMPMEIYFLPRFVLHLDSEEKNPESNPRDRWSTTFEGRWLRAFGAKLLLAAATAAGFLAFMIPGLLILFAFGWVPTRVLLRGEPLPQAMKGSLEMMRKGWRRALLMALAAFSLAFGAGLAAELPIVLALGDLQGYWRVLHPALFALRAVESLISLWLSAVLLAAFHRLEIQSESVK